LKPLELWRGDAVEGGRGERHGVEVFNGAIGRSGERGESGPRTGRFRGALETAGAPGIAGESQAGALGGQSQRRHNQRERGKQPRRIIDSRNVRCHIPPVKIAKPASSKKTPGTIRAEAIRARCNKLTDAERRKLRDEAMRLYYETEPRTAGAHRG
jgi:hypothetical protein